MRTDAHEPLYPHIYQPLFRRTRDSARLLGGRPLARRLLTGLKRAGRHLSHRRAAGGRYGARLNRIARQAGRRKRAVDVGGCLVQRFLRPHGGGWAGVLARINQGRLRVRHPRRLRGRHGRGPGAHHAHEHPAPHRLHHRARWLQPRAGLPRPRRAKRR